MLLIFFWFYREDLDVGERWCQRAKYLTLICVRLLMKCLDVCGALNIMKLTCVIQMHKSIFSIKNILIVLIFECIESHEWLWINYTLCLEIPGRVFSVELYFFFSALTCISVLFVRRIQFLDNTQGYSKESNSFISSAFIYWKSWLVS